MKDKNVTFSTFWVFVTLNYIYCDVFILFDVSRGSAPMGQSFLLGASVLMEIPMAMVILSRILKYKADRWANIIAGGIMTVAQALSLFVGPPTPYYLFFSVIEISCTLTIIWYAWKWSNHDYASGQQL
jgi:Family of unknown function (DUF6326)